MRSLSLGMFVITVAVSSGCSAPPQCLPPTGSRGLTYPIFNVQPNASTAIAGGDIGFLVTANGQGGFRVAWTDTLGSNACFSGILTVTGAFDLNQTAGISGYEQIQVSGANQLRFASAPSSELDGIELVSSTEPLYLDAYINGTTNRVSIFYTDASSAQTVSTDADPAAFTSH